MGDAATHATAAVMAHSKLTIDSGMASASAAAQQAKIKLQRRNQQELLEAALTQPQQRTQSQIEALCDFLSTVHLLRSVQPTALKSLAHAMTGQSHPAGDAIYTQADPARHLFVVLSGEVVMYEQDAPAAAAAAAQDSLQDTFAGLEPADPASVIGSGKSSSGRGSRLGSSSGLRPQQSPGRVQRAVFSPSAGGHPQQHSRLASPRRPASTASGGGRTSASSSAGGSRDDSTSSGTSSSSSSSGGGAGGLQQGAPRHSEVRRVKPREAFGEDEVTAGSRRQQTAVSMGATRTGTFSLGTSSSSSSNGGGSGSAPVSMNGTGGNNAMQSSAGAAAGGLDGSSDSAPAAAAPSAARAAAAAADTRSSQCVLLVLSAEDYGAALEGRLTSLLEEKVTFLAQLPSMKGLNMHYLRTLAHCFHQVSFEPREVVVRQGDVSDCMYVLKSGQVCILIDPSLTLAEASVEGGRSGSAHPTSSSTGGGGGGGGGVAEASTASDLDTKKLVQVCLLGSGTFIGDMSVRESGGGPARRSATVVALTELVTYKVPLKEFKRRMPADVLEGMRQVANQKLEMNGSKAQGRALANGRDGQVLLGGLALPECVLQGKGLRALMEAQQHAAPVGGLIQALELCVAPPDSPTGSSKGGRPCSPGPSPTAHAASTKKWFVSGTKAAQGVEGFLDSLTRNGYLTAPPTEFLALMTDWHSARTNNSAQQEQVPPDWLFPLPIPGKRPPTALQAAAASASSQLHPAMAPLAPLAHAATALGGDGAGSTWLEPAVTTTHTVIRSCPQTPQQQGSHLATTAGTGSSLASQPLLSSPTSLLAALSLDQYIQQSPLDSPTGGSKHTTRPSTPAGGSSTASSSSSRSLNAAGVAREAAQQLLCGGPSSPQATFRAAGGMGGRGQLMRGPLMAQAPLIKPDGGDVDQQTAATCTKAATVQEPTCQQASIKAAVLFRPGSPICVGRCAGSPRPQSARRGAGKAAAAGAPGLVVLEGLSHGVHAAVVTSRTTGKQEITFHGVMQPPAAATG